MMGPGQDRQGGRFVFPVIASLLIIISLMMFVSNRQAELSAEPARVAAAPDKPLGMGMTDMFIIPLTLMTMPLRGAENMFGDMRKRSDVFEENERLRARVAELSDAEMRANALAMKIKRFETLLSADAGIDIPAEKIAGRLVSENNGPFARSALLNVGAQSGVRTGHAVMTEDGLYGHIVAVGKRSSRVLLLQDINSRIAVISPRSEARAIMAGANTSEPKLLYVARAADWKDGDLVVTSGDEGVLPRGLPVGTLMQTGPDERRIKLASTGKPVDWVWVYPFQAPLMPEENPASEADLIDPAAADVAQTSPVEVSAPTSPTAENVETQN